MEKSIAPRNWILATTLLALLATGCGQTSRSGASSASGTVTTITSVSTATTTSTYTGDTYTGGYEAPHRYEFTLNGSQTAITPAISTDNVLKVRFYVNASQGNSVHAASELAVTLSVNGSEFVPQYTTSNYTYGQVGETSNLVDISAYITPGVPVQITVKNPKNDFYCTYWGGYNSDGSYVNPQYGSYPGCRKAVYTNHNWGGVIIVQTSATTAI